jgi:hypothetical protein
MEFTEATDRLTACPTHEDIAEAVGWKSVQSVRQARVAEDSPAYRRPVGDWQSPLALLRLANQLDPKEPKMPIGVGRILPFTKVLKDGNWSMLEVHNANPNHRGESFPDDGIDTVLVHVPVGRLRIYLDAIRQLVVGLGTRS